MLLVLNVENEKSDFIQFEVEIVSKKVSEIGELLHDSFNAITKKIENNNDMNDEIVKQLYKNISNHEKKGSGWIVAGIKRFRITYYIKSRLIKSYGSFVSWPEKAARKLHIVNIKTKDDCVRLSMVAHFCHEDVQKLKNQVEEARAYRAKCNTYL